MSEWQECKLNELISFVVDNRGKNPPYVSNGYDVIETGCISGKSKYPNYKVVKKFVDEYTYNNWFRKGHPLAGDLLIITVGNGIGSVSVMNENRGVITQNLIALRFNNDIANSNFYFYYINQEMIQDFLQSLNIGSAQPSLKVPHLLNLDVPLPPLPEQKAIASVLSSLDDKIDLLHRQNATLEKMAETLFQQWFIEEAKDDWEIIKLEKLITIGSGKVLNKNDFIEHGCYPILGANGEIGRTNKYLVDESLLFTGRVGTLGKIFRIEKSKVWLSDNTLVIKPLDFFNFIYFTLKNARLGDYNVGSTQPLIRQSDIKNIEIVLPPNNIIKEFEHVTETYFKKIKFNQTQISNLMKLRDTLLPKLMSGEVTVEL